MSASRLVDRLFPAVHVITDDRVLRRADFVAVATALLRSGGSRVAVHIRGHATGGGLMERCARALSGVRGDGGWIVINDRIDVAGVVAAEGVQLGRRSLPLGVAHRLVPGFLLGASVHDLEGARAAACADWLVVGTVYETSSHPGRKGAGPAHVGRVVRGVPQPVVAIGGITPDRIRRVRDEGASGVAVSSGIWGALDPVAALDQYLGAWESAA